MVPLTHIVQGPTGQLATDPMKSPTRDHDRDRQRGPAQAPSSFHTLCGQKLPAGMELTIYQGELRAGLGQLCNIAPRVGDCSWLVDLPA